MNIIPNLPILHSKKTVGKFVFTQNYLQSQNYRFQIIKEGPQNGLYNPKSAYEEVVTLLIFINIIYYKNKYQGE